MSGNSIFASKKFKTIMKFVYGWGGAVVIVGALFKILAHTRSHVNYWSIG